jgi:hypothetical protein
VVVDRGGQFLDSVHPKSLQRCRESVDYILEYNKALAGFIADLVNM